MRIESGTRLRDAREAVGLSQAKLAELTGIPQHLLSAIELEKTRLDASVARQLSDALKDQSRIQNLTGRAKRYRAHTYEPVERDPKRVERYKQTNGNREYLADLRALHDAKRELNFKTLSLFSGCGGLSLGFSWAGFDVKGFVELDEGLAGIYRANFPATRQLGADIAAMSDAEIKRTKTLLGDIDIIAGGPPCQGFSLSGKRSVRDPRNSLFLDYLRFVDVYQPKAAVMENVRLLTSMRSPDGDRVCDQIQREFLKRGYGVRYFEVNANDYGVPQHRERVFFIAMRNDAGSPPTFPRASHGTHSSDLFDPTRPHRTFADACSDLPYLESGDTCDDPMHAAVNHPKHVIEWLWDVREGSSAHDNDDPALRPPSGYNTTYKRQVWNEPGATVQTTFGMISGCRNVHPIATRSLTVREATRLQSFPDAFKFHGSLGTIRTGIGNAVPPMLAHAIAMHLRGVLR